MARQNIFRRALRLPGWKLRLLLEASFWLLVARAALVVLPFARIGRYLGSLQEPVGESSVASPEEIVMLKRVGHAVDGAADHLPLSLVCLPRALAGWQMLHRRGIESRLHFGAVPKSLTQQPGLQTHAWLSSHGVEITGYPVAHGCVELGYYARERQSAEAKRELPLATR